MRTEKLLREVYWGEVVERWPRVLEAVKWAACLSDGEGIACIRDYVAGRRTSGEAVDHFGGTAKVLERAASANTRHAVYEMHRDFERRMQTFAERYEHA
jgi:hypothetical protein